MNKVLTNDLPDCEGSVVVRSHKSGDIKWKKEGERTVVDIRSMKEAMGKPLEEIGPSKNLVVTSDGYGRNLILRQLSGNTTYGITIDSGAIGTGNTAPVDGNTALQTQVLGSIPVALFELTNNVLIVSFFIADADLTNTTYKEFGMFIGGRLFSRVIITPNYTKGAGIDTTIEYTLTLTS